MLKQPTTKILNVKPWIEQLYFVQKFNAQYTLYLSFIYYIFILSYYIIYIILFILYYILLYMYVYIYINNMIWNFMRSTHSKRRTWESKRYAIILPHIKFRGWDTMFFPGVQLWAYWYELLIIIRIKIATLYWPFLIS